MVTFWFRNCQVTWVKPDTLHFEEPNEASFQVAEWPPVLHHAVRESFEYWCLGSDDPQMVLLGFCWCLWITYLGVWWDIAMHQQRSTLFKSNKCLISQRFVRRAKCICDAKCIQLSWTPLPTFRKAGSRKPAKRCLSSAACAKAACTLAVDSWLWAR